MFLCTGTVCLSVEHRVFCTKYIAKLFEEASLSFRIVIVSVLLGKPCVMFSKKKKPPLPPFFFCWYSWLIKKLTQALESCECERYHPGTERDKP